MHEEFTTLEDAIKYDKESNMFRNLKLMGFKSLNGYRYTKEAFEDACDKYENRPVYLDHMEAVGSPNNHRRYIDRIGTVMNIKVDADRGLIGDMMLNKSHPAAAQVAWDIEHNTPGVGFSHRADCIEEKIKGQEGVVTKIGKVYSVDVVTEPASVSCFTDSVHVESENINKLIEELKTEIQNINKQLNKEQVIHKMDVLAEPQVELSTAEWVKKITRRI